jgi:exodeoxyribonuclease VII small subunit
MPDSDTKTKEPSFEEAMESLESIVASLETGQLPLEDMVTAYERGVKMLRACRERLESARQRVELITADLEGRGKASLSEFAPLDAPEAPSPESSRKTKRKSAAQDDAAAGEGSKDIRLF